MIDRGTVGRRWLDVRSRSTDLVGRRLNWTGASVGRVVHCTALIDGSTVTRVLSPDQLERYPAGFDNARRLHEFIAELEALSLQAVEHTERWAPKP